MIKPGNVQSRHSKQTNQMVWSVFYILRMNVGLAYECFILKFGSQRMDVAYTLLIKHSIQKENKLSLSSLTHINK